MRAADYDVETLNDLIATTIDSSASGEDALAGRRAAVADRLQDQVRALGGNPADEGTSAVSAQRLLGGETGEDTVRAKFELALTDRDLLGETRALIEQCYRLLMGEDETARPLAV